jgi:hypothetical protein
MLFPDRPRRGVRARARLVLCPAAGLLLAAAVAGLWPGAQRWTARHQAAVRTSALIDSHPHPLTLQGPALAAPLGVLAAWQTVGGCGAGASTGSGGGIKWIGRGVTGGAVNSQFQASYTRLATDPERPEHHLFGNALVSTDLGDRVSAGVNVPVVYKYMRDPFHSGADLSNSGMGDISGLLTLKLGAIRATSLTATVGFPTGQHDGRYKMRILNQSQQRGFGKPTASLLLDHVSDEIWGLTVVGASGSWRGGENEINNYRAPSASAYAYVGYFLGELVPAIGLTLTGLSGHDRDQTVEQVTGLYLAAPSVSLEWSADWVAVLVGASFPYQYDGVEKTTEGRARTPHGWGPWMVGMGFSFAPF